MSGYIQAGYVIVIATLAVYSVSVVVRERAARRRLSVPAAPTLAANPTTGETVAGSASSVGAVAGAAADRPSDSAASVPATAGVAVDDGDLL